MRRLEAGGFQTVEAYDVLIANLDPTLERAEPPEDPLEAVRRFPGGLVTQEVAAIMAHNNELPDRLAAERVADRAARRRRRQAHGAGRRRALADRLSEPRAADLLERR